MKPVKEIVVKKEELYISNTHGLLSKNFASSPFKSNNNKQVNSTNERQIKNINKFYNHYDQSFHTNLHTNQKMHDDHNQTPILKSQMKKSNSSSR